MAKTEAPMTDPSHMVHLALRAEAAGQKTPSTKTQVIGGARMGNNLIEAIEDAFVTVEQRHQRDARADGAPAWQCGR